MKTNFFLFCTLLLSLISIYSTAQDTIRSNYPNTQQKWERVFVNDQKLAENIYHANGTPWMTVQYSNKKAEEWKWYHDNGQPFFRATIVNDLLEGDYRVWYENGQLAELLYFVNNREEGPGVFFHPNGQVAMRGWYQDGEMVGEWQFYDENGNPPEGQWSWAFAALPKFTRISGEFRDGKPYGKWTYKTTDGKRPKTFVKVY